MSGGTSPAGRLDLKEGELVLDGTKTSYADLKAWLYAGAAPPPPGGTGPKPPSWTGPGIMSSVAAADTNQYRSIGYAHNSELKEPTFPGNPWVTWRGRAVDPDSLVVRYTYAGDSTMDGKITLDDYYAWKSGFNAFNASDPGLEVDWFNGDYNYDGRITLDDYYIWKSSFNANLPPLPGDASTSAGGAASAMAAVPEPATVVMLGAGALALMTWAWRWRRRAA